MAANPPTQAESADSSTIELMAALLELEAAFLHSPEIFKEKYPIFKQGSHKIVRKIASNEKFLFAHAKDKTNNGSISEELQSYSRFKLAGLRTPRVTGLIDVPAMATCGLKGITGFLVEFVTGDKVKPLQNAFATYTKYADTVFDKVWANSEFLGKIVPRKANHSAIINDLIKLHDYSLRNGLSDFQVMYKAPRFTLIDPPNPTEAPKTKHSEQLRWLMQMLNFKSEVKVKLPKQCASRDGKW
jgi:hypothetical protein